ncbi:MAG: site-specific integrase [Candidatus Micrarchaeota archaeon]|nr:site-specific integrase [Candidatus Micrarchaeota archaeon]
MNKEALSELVGIEAQLDRLLPQLSKSKVRELKQLIANHYVKKYQVQNKPLKYGTLNKGFDSQELEAFLKNIDNLKYSLLFSYMAYLGLRIGEVVKVNVKDINHNRELTVFTEKARVLNTLVIPLPLFERTQQYIAENKSQIDNAEGYLFFADKKRSKRQEPYLELNYVRKVFRGYCQSAGLDEVYSESEESVEGRTKRQLHRLTTHSLRHFAITTFSKKTNGNLVLTSRFARHLAPSTTLHYIHSDKTELYSFIEQMIKPIEVKM